MACSRMDNHPSGLIDDGQIVIFIYDFDRDILRPGIRYPGFRDRQFDIIPDPDLITGFDFFSVDRQMIFFQQLLDMRPGQIRLFLTDKQVKTVSALLRPRRIRFMLGHGCLSLSPQKRFPFLQMRDV